MLCKSYFLIYSFLLSTGFPIKYVLKITENIAIGRTMYIGTPNPAGIYPNIIVNIPINKEYHIWVLTCSIWLQPAPIEDNIVVSDIGEQWSPKIAPVSTALVLTIT